jgi:hypothetical protein
LEKKKQKETPPPQIHEWQKEQYPKKEVEKSTHFAGLIFCFVFFFLSFAFLFGFAVVD